MTSANVVQIKDYLAPPPAPQRSLYELYPLPFFNRDKLSTWNVTPTGKYRPQALSLHGSIIISLPLGPGWNEFGPAVVRVRTAKSAVAGDHLLHAHFVGWQTAIVMKGMARTSARAPRHLSGLADAKVEQHCHRYGHYDEH
jgi:hypothetical protein